MEQPIYASPTGAGLRDGSAPEHALCGLPAAAEAARRLEGPVSVHLLPGRYTLTETLRLDARDSGTSFIGEDAVIGSGIPVTAWREVETGLAAAPVPVGARFTRLYVGGSCRDRARFPAEGHLTPRSPNISSSNWAANMSEEEQTELSKRLLQFDPQDIPAGLHRPEDVEFVILQYWMEARLYAEKLDMDRGEALFREGSWRPLRWSFGYYLDNCREGLSVPGRWYHDRQENMLYYRLQEGESAETLDAEIPALQTLIEAAPAEGDTLRDISFTGVTFTGTNAHAAGTCYHSIQAELNAPTALRITGTEGIRFTRCRFSGLGGWGLWLGAGCKHGTVERCTFSHCGAGAVRFGEAQRPTHVRERTERNIFRNNRIADCGEFFLGSAGIWVGQSGYNTIAHNDISGPLQWAISVGWNWAVFPLNYSRGNRVEKNFVHELGTGTLGTHGALYVLGVSPETVVEGNYIRGVYSTPYWGAGEGIILDNSCSGITVQNNIVTHASAGGWGCNFDCFGNVIRNNILCYGQKFQLTRYGDAPNTPNPPPNGEVFSQNIVLWDEGPFFQEEDWYAYRTFWDYNLYWKTDGNVSFMGRSLAEWNELGLDIHSVVADPRFADPAHGDFTLPDDSPAYAIGFEPIDMSDVGILPEN